MCVCMNLNTYCFKCKYNRINYVAGFTGNRNEIICYDDDWIIWCFVSYKILTSEYDGIVDIYYG